MPSSTHHVQFLNLPHITPISCEKCGGKAHLILLTAQAARNEPSLDHTEIWTFECVDCRCVIDYRVDD